MNDKPRINIFSFSCPIFIRSSLLRACEINETLENEIRSDAKKSYKKFDLPERLFEHFVPHATANVVHLAQASATFPTPVSVIVAQEYSFLVQAYDAHYQRQVSHRRHRLAQYNFSPDFQSPFGIRCDCDYFVHSSLCTPFGGSPRPSVVLPLLP